MNKYDKILKVREFNLNTENSVLIKTPQQNPFNSDVSIRTQWKNPSNKKTPHYSVVKKENYNKVLKEILNNNLEAIVGDCINPKDCLFAGCIFRDYNKLHIEIAHGPGTVRRVTHQNIIDESYYNLPSLMPRTNNLNLNKVLLDIYHLERIKEVPPSYIFEFSYYKNKVGIKKQNQIFWEFYEV